MKAQVVAYNRALCVAFHDTLVDVLAERGVPYEAAVVMTTGSPFPVTTVTFVGEFLLALWLLIRGHRLTQDDTHPAHHTSQGARPLTETDR